MTDFLLTEALKVDSVDRKSNSALRQLIYIAGHQSNAYGKFKVGEFFRCKDQTYEACEWYEQAEIACKFYRNSKVAVLAQDVVDISNAVQSMKVALDAKNSNEETSEDMVVRAKIMLKQNINDDNAVWLLNEAAQKECPEAYFELGMLCNNPDYKYYNPDNARKL